MSKKRTYPVVIGALGLLAPLFAPAASTFSVESLQDPLVYPGESRFAESTTKIIVTSPGLRRQTEITVSEGVRVRIYYASASRDFSVVTRYKGTTAWFVGDTSGGEVKEYRTKNEAIKAAKNI